MVKILITGGAGNVGGALARKLVENPNYFIIIVDNLSTGSKSKLPSKEFTNWSFINCDVNNYNQMKLFISKLKKLDILVNNAGTNIPEPFLSVKKSSLETLLNVNTKAVFNVAQLCANQIIKLKRKSGSIINISSIFGLVAGQKRTVYSMTKFGVEGLTKGMALDLAKYNIRVNSVCPTFVATPRAKKYLANKKFNKYALDNIPLGRIATESDVATAITFLSSNAASMIT